MKVPLLTEKAGTHNQPTKRESQDSPLFSRKDERGDVLPSFRKNRSQNLLSSSRKDTKWETQPSVDTTILQNKVVQHIVLQERRDGKIDRKCCHHCGQNTCTRDWDPDRDEKTGHDWGSPGWRSPRWTWEKTKHQDMDRWRPEEGMSSRHGHRNVLWSERAGEIRGVVRNWSWQEWGSVDVDTEIPKLINIPASLYYTRCSYTDWVTAAAYLQKFILHFYTFKKQIKLSINVFSLSINRKSTVSSFQPFSVKTFIKYV